MWSSGGDVSHEELLTIHMKLPQSLTAYPCYVHKVLASDDQNQSVVKTSVLGKHRILLV